MGIFNGIRIKKSVIVLCFKHLPPISVCTNLSVQDFRRKTTKHRRHEIAEMRYCFRQVRLLIYIYFFFFKTRKHPSHPFERNQIDGMLKSDLSENKRSQLRFGFKTGRSWVLAVTPPRWCENHTAPHRSCQLRMERILKSVIHQ